MTSKPLRASSPAQVMPDGPEPTTATFLPFLGAILGVEASSGRSPRKRSSWPMATGSDFLPRMHLPSHWFSCGQTRPQIAGSMESSRMVSRAPPKSFARICSIKRGMLMLTGQPSTQNGFLQLRQRSASASAISSVKPLSTGRKSQARSAAGSSLSGVRGDFISATKRPLTSGMRSSFPHRP